MIRSNVVNLLSTLLLLGYANQPAVAEGGPPRDAAQTKLEAESWLSDGTRRLNAGTEVNIQRARIFPVPTETREEAIRLLESASIVPLGNEALAHLLSGKSPTGDEALKNAIADAPDEAKFFSAPSADASIAYARTLFGMLRPYLVRAVIANDGGVFRVTLSGDTLAVFNGSLGPIDYEQRPIVVFLERQPTRVSVTAASAM